jgi:tRNA(Ile)-lysidine synthase
MDQLLTDDVKQQCQSLIDAPTWWVALSGGMDSVVLLHLLCALIKNPCHVNPPRLVAIHIHHDLSPNADQWQHFCARLCDQLGCELVVGKVAVVNRGKGLEAEARALRYRAIAEQVAADDVVFTGHHQDDQVETLLLRLLRGAGLMGLRGIKADGQVYGCRLVRLLLTVPRAQIEEYGKRYQLSWVNDESNDNLHFSRNYMRREILPLLAAHWPSYRTAVTRSGLWLTEAEQALAEYAEQDLLSVAGDDRWGHYMAIPVLLSMSLVRRKTVLRYWLIGRECMLPSAVEFVAIVDQLGDADSGAELYRGEYRLMVFAQKLYIDRGSKTDKSDYHFTVESLPSVLDTPAGRLYFTEPSYDRVDQGFAVAASLPLTVVSRQAGQSVRPVGRGGSRRVKKLLQEHQVANWFRQNLPMIYAANEVVAVADCVACEHAGASEITIIVRWQPLIKTSLDERR